MKVLAVFGAIAALALLAYIAVTVTELAEATHDQTALLQTITAPAPSAGSADAKAIQDAATDTRRLTPPAN